MIACSYSQKKLQKVSKQLSSCNVLILCHGYIIVCSTLTLLPRIPVKCPHFCLISVLKTANFQRNETYYLNRLKELQVTPQYLMLQKNHLFKGLNLWWLWSEQIEVVNAIFKVGRYCAVTLVGNRSEISIFGFYNIVINPWYL